MWLLAVLLVCASLQPSWAYGDDDAQYIQPVKGGHSGRVWMHGSSLYRPQQNGSFSATGTGYGIQHNVQIQQEHEVGVCYMEVPTASLVRDRSHVPAGNGSRPDLSRIRTCCKGYERNIYNFLKCDPVCTTECVNALCVAPETCSCYPDHVKNQAGVCTATCPIGCQNGRCDGGECLCNEGYKLDIDGKYCVPYCKDNCGGIGTCTGPNVCDCKREGYHPTPDGSCRAECDRCVNGDCVAPNLCRCRQGYEMDLNGECKPICQPDCGLNSRCVSPNNCASAANTGPVNPNGYPSQYVTQRPGQPQYPGSQQSYNPSNPQQYPSGSGHYIVNSENTHYTGNSQQTSYNATGFVQYPQNPQTYPQYNPSGISQYPQQPPYPQHNSSGTGYHPSNPQQPSYPQYNSTGISEYPQQPAYPQHNSTGTGYHPSYPQQPSYPQYNPSGIVQYPGYPQESTHTQYPSGPLLNPLNLRNFSRPQNNSLAPSQFPTNPHQSPYGHNYPSNPQQSSSSPDFTVIPIDQTLQFGYPQCSQQCINATCVDGNRCVCNAGFVPDIRDPTESRCIPYCPGGCPNGDCISPYSCACHDGYKMESYGVKGARPRCVRRDRRSLNQYNMERSKRKANIADFLVYMIPDYDN